MRQVPAKNYLIIGQGRAAKHLDFYLNDLGHQTFHWHYRIDPSVDRLKALAAKSDRVLLLIKDSAIASFLETHPFLRHPHTVHFSGSLNIPDISNVHPLISFGHELFTSDFYPQIPFALFTHEPAQKSSVNSIKQARSNRIPDEATIEERPSLEFFLPGVSNPSFYIPQTSKPLYHGLCVASGNLMVLLWQMVGEIFQKEWHLNTEALKPFLESVTTNLKTHWTQALTGPIARRDEMTLLKNYEALMSTPLREIFEAHVKSAWPEFAEKHFKPSTRNAT